MPRVPFICSSPRPATKHLQHSQTHCQNSFDHKNNGAYKGLMHMVQHNPLSVESWSNYIYLFSFTFNIAYTGFVCRYIWKTIILLTTVTNFFSPVELQETFFYFMFLSGCFFFCTTMLSSDRHGLGVLHIFICFSKFYCPCYPHQVPTEELQSSHILP